MMCINQERLLRALHHPITRSTHESRTTLTSHPPNKWRHSQWYELFLSTKMEGFPQGPCQPTPWLTINHKRSTHERNMTRWMIFSLHICGYFVSSFGNPIALGWAINYEWVPSLRSINLKYKRPLNHLYRFYISNSMFILKLVSILKISVC